MLSAEEIDDIAGPNGMRPRAYTDAALFELEMERIFERTWIYVAHESELINPGDYRRSRLGKHEVIVVRLHDGSVKVLFNACTHRGTRLCARQRGNTQRFVCPYHAWSFRLDGTLHSVPNVEDYPGEFTSRDGHALKSAARTSSYRGFIFASLAREGPSLCEFLGSMTGAIDNLIERAPDGVITIASKRFRVRYRANWKLHHENANDTLHPGFVHASSVQTARRASETSRRLDEGQTVAMMSANGFSKREWDSVELTGLAQGHSFMGGFYKSGLLGSSDEDEASRTYFEALSKTHGKERATDILRVDRFNNLIWPTLNVNAQFHQIRIVHPISVDETIIEGCCFKLEGAPDAIFHRAVRFLTTLVSPASMIFSDDLEIFERVQHGLSAGCLERVDASRGCTTDKASEDATIRMSGGASELPNRVQAQAWRQWMGGTAAPPAKGGS